MRPLDTFCCEALDPEMLLALRGQLSDYRGQQLGQLMADLQTPQAAELLGPKMGPLREFLTAILEVAEQSPEDFSRLLNHWALTFLLRRLLERPLESQAFEQVMSSLWGLLVHLRLQQPRGNATYTTLGTWQDFLGEAKVEIPSHAGRRVTWKFESQQAELLDENGNLIASSALPEITGLPLTRVAWPVSAVWNLPVIADMASMGLVEHRPPPTDPQWIAPADWTPPKFTDHLDQARPLLAELWPEVLQWADVLLPGFADLGGPPSPITHLSDSFEAGGPIFLTTVPNAFECAETLVHELQHERLYLFTQTGDFSSWLDLRPRFVSLFRRDPRPLRGLLMGAHAFIAVNALRLREMRLREPKPASVMAALRHHRMNLQAWRTVIQFDDSGPNGLRLLATMGRYLSDQHQALESRATPEMSAEVDRRLSAHLAAVKTREPSAVNTGSEFYDWEAIARKATEFAEQKG